MHVDVGLGLNIYHKNDRQRKACYCWYGMLFLVDKLENGR